MTNDSDFVITQFFVTEVGSTTFGANLLTQPLQPGEQLTIDVACGTFDVLIVDQQNVNCELHDLDLCLNNADFVIRNATCTVFGAK